VQKPENRTDGAQEQRGARAYKLDLERELDCGWQCEQDDA
jgi:hypothetical protein